MLTLSIPEQWSSQEFFYRSTDMLSSPPRQSIWICGSDKCHKLRLIPMTSLVSFKNSSLSWLRVEMINPQDFHPRWNLTGKLVLCKKPLLTSWLWIGRPHRHVQTWCELEPHYIRVYKNNLLCAVTSDNRKHVLSVCHFRSRILLVRWSQAEANGGHSSPSKTKCRFHCGYWKFNY